MHASSVFPLCSLRSYISRPQHHTHAHTFPQIPHSSLLCLFHTTPATLRKPLNAHINSQVRARKLPATGPVDDSDEAPDLLTTRPRNKPKRKSRHEDKDDEGEEDPFYAEAAEAARSKKKHKRDTYTAPVTRPPLALPEAEGPRKVSKAVEKNRGLTPHRRRDLKNPRVKVGTPSGGARCVGSCVGVNGVGWLVVVWERIHVQRW